MKTDEMIFISKGAATAKAISYLLRGQEARIKRLPRGEDGLRRYEVIVKEDAR